MSSFNVRRVKNFYAGPGALPITVLEKIESDLPSYKGTGISVMELSHRSTQVVDLINDTLLRIRTALALDDQWEVMLLQGGGSQQFLMLPLNLSKQGERIDYIDSGYWSQRAIREAETTGRDVSVIASGIESNFNCLPEVAGIESRSAARYLHLCSNNTVVGTQWHQFPETSAPLVMDASSDFLSRRFNLDNVSCIYAHAQKNIGLAGVTVVALRRSALVEGDLPAYLDYRSHFEAGSNYHTPPVFSIYVTNLMLQWLEQEMGGVAEIERFNRKKARLLYEVIGGSELFDCPVDESSRSLMNVVFSSGDKQLDLDFVRYCEQRDIIGIAGHRTRGGLRASLYNAVSYADVVALADTIEGFAKTAKR